MLRISLLAFVALVCSSTLAEPCVVTEVPHEIDPSEQRVDRTPPAQVSGHVIRIARGHGPVNGGWGSCDEYGGIVIELEGARDDRTPTEKLGYRITVVSGNAPDQLSGLTRVVRALGDSSRWSIGLSWADDASDAQEAIDFTVVVNAIDLAGNEGPRSRPIRIRHPGVVAPPMAELRIRLRPRTYVGIEDAFLMMEWQPEGRSERLQLQWDDARNGAIISVPLHKNVWVYWAGKPPTRSKIHLQIIGKAPLVSQPFEWLNVDLRVGAVVNEVVIAWDDGPSVRVRDGQKADVMLSPLPQ